VLETTLRHELLHLLVESHAKPGTPLWFREGLVLYLSQPGGSATASGTIASDDALNKALRSPTSEDEMRSAYADARARVTAMIAANGKGTIIQWLQQGLPKSASR
jgi:stage II sporulation protein D